MDATLGYTDDRIRIGWFAARITGGLLVILFFFHGRVGKALAVCRADHRKRLGFNSGIPMNLIAGGCKCDV
jgi:adenosylcobinamide-phosphate synthase